jgi:CheY-like chemotaxis protein
MLLVEPEPMLRRTVALTARSLGLAQIEEAGNNALARQLLSQQKFDGAVIDIECGDAYDLALLDQVRQGRSISKSGIPIAVLASRVDPPLLQALRERGVSRIIVKPFRARVLLDAFAALAEQ